MFRKNVAGQFLYFALINAATGAALSGATVSVRRSIDGTFAAATGTVTEDTGLGFYKLALSQADTNGNDIAFFFTATSAIPVEKTIVTTAADPTDAVRFGLTALPNAAAAAIGGLLTAPTTANVGLADLARILGTAITETAGQIAAGFKKVFDVAAPVFTAASVNQTGDNFVRLGAPAGASHAADVAAVKVDTAAVKVQTDKLVFTVANQVDVNVIDWKGATAPAMTGDAFARLGAPAGASVSADVAAAKVDTAAIKVQSDKLTFTVANQVDSNVIDWKGSAAPAMTGDAYARLGAPAGASVSADVAAVKSDTGTILTDVNSGAGAIYTRIGAPAGASIAADVAAVNAKTTNLPASPAAVGSAMTLTATYDFAKGTTAMTEAYAADGVAPSPVQCLLLIQQMLAETSIISTTLTVKKLDGSTAAAVFTLDSATTPTSVTRSS